ncbi:HAD-IIB family hydrolase [Clostridium brassicae]|uniref:HAD-IIB family hydrolase n=1 Tax=Clostridium brassicae TaxID=2999072 RepID=A0ABT4D819_9CLOT|nr:HAD-IIB family hydrolase [Clostridium brassicae]MCY6958438.1 HAD-IIB family hydrolase [Clostridium brassicae]
MKVLVSDLDGTLISTVTKQIELNDIKGIKKFQNRGNVFIPATGRGVVNYSKAISKYNIPPHDYAILSNGSVIIDKEFHVIRSKGLNIQIINKVIPILLSIDFSKIVEITMVEINHNYTFNTLKDLEYGISNLNKEKVLTISLEFKSTTHRRNAETKFRSLNNLYFELLCNNQFIDILPKNVNKAEAIKFLLDNYIVGHKELYTIGDGENDLCMFKMTKNSYTFNRVDTIIKEEANNIIDNFSDIMKLIM